MLVSFAQIGLVTAVIAMGLFVPVGATGIEGIEVGDLRSKLGVEKMGGSSRTIILIGASYAGGWNPGRPIVGFQIVNRGVSGQQSFEMLSRFETDVLALKPDAVIIWGFINDIFRSDRAQIAKTLMRTRESTLAMVKLARKEGIMPILATEVTIRSKDGWLETFEALIGRILGKSSYQDYVNGHVVEVNRWIRDTAAREGILLLDLEMVLADQHGVRRKEFSQLDGSHISNRGYEALTQYAENQLKAVIESR